MPDVKVRGFAIRATRDVAKARPWSQPRNVQRDMAQALVLVLAEDYGMSVPRVHFVSTPSLGAVPLATGGTEIYLDRFSLLTLLHEFRHCWQMQLGQRHLRTRAEAERDAQAWSLAVFSKACPRRFSRMLRSGRILFAAEHGYVAGERVHTVEELREGDAVAQVVGGFLEEHGLTSIRFVDPSEDPVEPENGWGRTGGKEER